MLTLQGCCPSTQTSFCDIEKLEKEALIDNMCFTIRPSYTDPQWQAHSLMNNLPTDTEFLELKSELMKQNVNYLRTLNAHITLIKADYHYPINDLQCKVDLVKALYYKKENDIEKFSKWLHKLLPKDRKDIAPLQCKTVLLALATLLHRNEQTQKTAIGILKNLKRDFQEKEAYELARAIWDKCREIYETNL